ncbi:MAG: hypothetical protein ABI790_00180 [Betaproteobacteria bacterium]
MRMIMLPAATVSGGGLQGYVRLRSIRMADTLLRRAGVLPLGCKLRSGGTDCHDAMHGDELSGGQAM